MRHPLARVALLASTLPVLLACEAPVPTPEAGRSAAWGYVTLLPRVAGSPAAAYGDRRLRDARLVDYSRPGFMVVYVEPVDGAAAGRGAGGGELRIRPGSVAARLEPRVSALRVGDAITIRNHSGQPHLVSCPAAGAVLSLASGASETLTLDRPGEYAFFLLDGEAAASTVFAAPGAHTVVSESGRFDLTGLAPGRRRLHTWHPRLPPTSQSIDLMPGQARRVDIEVGVGTQAEDDSLAR